MNPEIVLGPPGTGKTTTLLGLVEAELAQGTRPDRIGYVSFTKRAAKEAIERACAKFKLEPGELPYFRTLHSLCFQCLGISTGDVFERTKVREFSEWIGVELSTHFSMEEGSTFGFKDGDRAMFMENLARVTCKPLRALFNENDDNLSWGLVDYLARGVKKWKETNHLVDYTDMLSMFCDMEWSPDLDVLFVDEAQDLSQLQWRVVHRLAANCRRVVVAGDDDQAIYRWAGADVDYFLDLVGRVSVLHQSWRVPHAVQQLSGDVIKRISRRRPKDWLPRQAEGTVDYIRKIDELDLRKGDDILVLVRNSFVLREFMPSLRSDGIIFEWRGHNSVKSSTLEVVEAWERLRMNQDLTVDEVRKIYQFMSSGVGVKRGYKTLPGRGPDDKTNILDLIANGGLLTDKIWHEALDRIPLEEKVYMLRARQMGESLKKKPRVRLSTIHASKGGEADHVVLFSDMAPRTAQEAYMNPDDEVRVWYVGLTRAKTRLTIVAPRAKNSFMF